MEPKTTWVKFTHFLAFLLLASLSQTLRAGHLEREISDGLVDVIQLPMAKQENENEVLLKQSDHCKGKSYWPELVGVDGEEAKEIIEKENPNVTIVQIFPVVIPVTFDFRCDRVRIFVYSEGKVLFPPRIG